MARHVRALVQALRRVGGSPAHAFNDGLHCAARPGTRQLNAWAGNPPTLRSFAAALATTLSVAANAAPEPQAAGSVPAAASAPETQAPAPAAQVPAQPPLAQPPGRPATVPAPAVMPAAPAVGSLLQTTLALVFVLALLAGLAWFLKRYGPKAGGGNAHLRVVGALSLGGRERIMVVEVGDQWIVVGASPGRVNALATMPRQPGVEPSAVLAAHLPPAAGFADWLKQTIDKRNAK